MNIPIPVVFVFVVWFLVLDSRLFTTRTALKVAEENREFWHGNWKEAMAALRLTRNEVNERDRDIHAYSGSRQGIVFTYPHNEAKEKA